MNEAQSKLYELLIKFDTRCRQYGIEYYLSGGTMIGAIRHHGFIPWDDDVDLYVSRSNYNKLLACKESFFDDDFVLVNSEDFPKYGNTVMRLVDTHSTSITKARLFDDTPKGEFLELFILDPLPDESGARDRWLTKHWIYAELKAFAFRVANARIEPWIDEDLYNYYFERYKTEGRDVVLKELENELFTIEETEVNSWCSRWGIAVRMYPIEWFGKPRYVPFEDIELPVPAAVERVLRYEYGDAWAYIPPTNNQVTHSIIRNQKVGYRQFVDEYLRYMDEEELFNSYPKRDKASLDTYFAQRATRAKRLRIKEAHILGALSRMHQVSANKDEQGKAADYACTLWRNYQLSSDFWKWQICIDLSDDDLAFCLEHLVESDGFSSVKMLLEWRKRTHMLSKKLSEIDYFVCTIAEIHVLVDSSSYDEARTVYESLAKDKCFQFRNMYDMRYLDVLLDTMLVDRISDLESLLHKAQTLVNDFPESGDALFLLGKIEHAAGLKNRSIEHLNQARLMTRNAFFLREIDELVPCTNDGQKLQKTSEASETSNDAQAVLIKLLSEIHEVCQEEDIPYFLANENSLSAYRCGQFESDVTHLEILMLFKDARKLAEKLSDRPQRVVESIYTNKKYPDIAFRYCDTETTRVMLDGRNLQYEHRCLCVDIEILKKPYQGTLGRLTKRLESRWRRYREYPGETGNTISHPGLFKRTQGCCRALLKPLFRHSQQSASFNDALYVRFLSGTRKDFPKKVFSTQQPVTLEGQPSFVAGDYAQYFSSMYGQNWTRKTIKPKQEKQTTIIDAHLPYKQFALDIESAGETLDFTAEFAEQRAMKQRYDALDGKITYAWNIALRTEAKFRMQEHYASHKQEIIALYKQEKWSELVELFAEYDDVAITYEKKHLSVKFDDELFSVYLDVLLKQRRDELAKRLKELSSNERPLSEACVVEELNSNSSLSENAEW